MKGQIAAKGVLLLSHCGFSFLEDLIEALDARGLRSYVLSSLPLAAHRSQRLAELQEKASRLWSTDAHELTHGDVDRTLAALQGEGETVLACLSVWEGYRALMAHANSALGIPDLAPEKILGLRDKLSLRNQLYDAGLSEARAHPLTPELLALLRNIDSRYFIKPVSGIASYGAFPVRADTTWATIQRIRDEAKDDIVYRSALSEGMPFLVENHVPGREFSFELIVTQGDVHVVGIHEKCEVTQATGTVLEDSCTSPPYSIPPTAVAEGMAWVRALFVHLALDWGCFHVEGRFDGLHWDLIEINRRVGGSLISHSIKALNGQHSALELWLDLLLAFAGSHAAGPQEYLDKLASLSYTPDGASGTTSATFFRVYFATPGRIERIGLRDMSPAPIVSHVLLQPGDEIANTAREVFLGQLLWQMTREERDATLPALIRHSDNAIEIRYARQECVREGVPS